MLEAGVQKVGIVHTARVGQTHVGWTKRDLGERIIGYCHNPTNNPKQLKTIFVGVVLVSVRETTPQLGSSRKLIFCKPP